MAKTTVCHPVMSEPYEPSYCGAGDRELCPIVHDCAGAVGRYVRIRLRGERRIFDAKVDVSRFSSLDVAGVDDDAGPHLARGVLAGRCDAEVVSACPNTAAETRWIS